ncbi:hypothetical protein HZC53_03255 [Candidatus Uhrbacteria bacterium]|nr:hypothetical protein [Candidatus Uhrbacteria bacterium]
MNMRTYLVPATLAMSALMLFGAGCGKSNQAQTAAGQPEEKKGIFSSIKDAFNNSITLRCDYLDEAGNTTVTYIKNKKIFLEEDLKTGGETGLEVQKVKGIITDDKMYMWSDASDKGLIIDLKQPKDGNAPKMGDKEIHSTDDVISKLEEKKERCKPATIEDSKFELPTNVQFLGL